MVNLPTLIFLTKFVHAASSVNNLLFTGIKRVAGGADFHMKFFFTQGRTGYELITTTANDLDILISRMDFRFHNRPFSDGAQSEKPGAVIL
jgi:hypothetical protein